MFVLAKELGGALGDGLAATRRPRARGVLTIYVAGFVLGAPIQLAAHALYDAAQPLPWAIALGWTFVINAVLGRQLERMRRHNEVFDRLRRQRRLVAIGEMTARVLHHTRHQMGLVGMIAHQIARHLDGLSRSGGQPDPAGADQAGRGARRSAAGAHRRSGRFGGTGRAPRRSRTDRTRRSSARRRRCCSRWPPSARSTFTSRSPPTLPTRIGPNKPVPLAQAFLNVLENAISAATRRVTVQLGRQGGVVTITVSDDGPGMEPSLLARATEPFVTTKAGGSGMGLAITRAVVEEEDGELHIANGAAGGLVVQMRLPLIGTRSRSGRAAPPGASGPARREPAESASRDS